MKTIRLGDVADVRISGVDKKTLPNEIPVRLCNYTDVYYNWAIREEKSQTFMLASAKQDEITRFRLHAGQVAITKDSETREDIGHATFIANDFDDVILGYHCALITPHAGKLDGQYLNALFRMHYVSDYLSRNAGGSGQRYYLSESAIRSIPLFLPPINAQLRIAGVLGSIDEKIELNRKKITELEALAKTIYDYWFVQFDFPDKNGKPYKSSGGKMVWNDQLKREVPEGWEVARIGSHIRSNRGISYSTKNIASGKGFPMINLNSFNVDSTYKVAGIKTFEGDVLDNKLLEPFDLVMCNTQQTDLDPKKDIIGKSFLVPDIFDSPVTSSHHVTSIHVDDDDLKVFLNSMFHTIEFHSYISGFASGTSIRGLNFFGVESCIAALPPKSLLSRFASLIMACEKQKSTILRDQALLQPLRDMLLPLLMNGQVEVRGEK